MDKKLQELLDWMFFRTLRTEAIEILTNQLAPVQRDAIIEKLEVLKRLEGEKEKIGTRYRFMIMDLLDLYKKM